VTDDPKVPDYIKRSRLDKLFRQKVQIAKDALADKYPGRRGGGGASRAGAARKPARGGGASRKSAR